MFVSKRAFRQAEDEIIRLQTELRQTQRWEADQQSRAQDVADAMLAARADARQVRLRAEDEAAAILARAREEAITLTEAAQVAVTAAREEVERLERVQRELSASVEQSVAAARPPRPHTGGPYHDDPADEHGRGLDAEAALGQFPSEAPATELRQPSGDTLPEKVGTDQRAPVHPLMPPSNRFAAGEFEPARTAWLRPAAVAAAFVCLLGLFAIVWWSRQTGTLEKRELSASTLGTRTPEGGLERTPEPRGTGAPARHVRPTTAHGTPAAVGAVPPRVPGRRSSGLVVAPLATLPGDSPRADPSPLPAAPGVAVNPIALPPPPQPASPPVSEPSRSEAAPVTGEPVDPAGAQVLTGDESDVLRAHEAYFHALGRGDGPGVARLTGDGFTRTGGLATDGSGTPFPIALSQAAVEVRGVGAVVSGMASQRVQPPDGPPRDQPLLFSEVWIKRDDRWQLTSVRFVSAGPGR